MTPSPSRKTWSLLAVGAIMLLGFALRVYDLGNQSLWGDEIASVAPVPLTSTLSQYLAAERMRSPDGVPPYFILVYSAQALGIGIPGIRLIGILIAIWAVPLLYLIGRDTHSRVAGCCAALFYALSPYHIFLDQGVRPYGIANLLILAAIYALLRATQSGERRWWVANFLLNVAAIYTHLTSVFILPAQGLFLLLYGWRGFRHAALWSAVHVAAIFPVTLFMLVPPFEPLYQTPSLAGLVTNLVGDDVLSLNIELWPEQFFPWIPTALTGLFPQARPLLDAMLPLGFVILLLGAGLAAMAVWRRAPETGGDPAPRSRAVLFMLFIAIVPALVLFVISYVREPMPMPRYSSFSNFGVYGAAGVGLAGLSRWASIRNLLLGFMVVGYGVQLLIFLPVDTRTQFQQAAEQVTEHSAPGDILFSGSTADGMLDIDRAITFTMGFYLDEATNPIYCGRSQPHIAENAICFLQANPDKQVWVVLFRLFNGRRMEEFERVFEARNIEVTWRDYGAMSRLTVYRLRASATATLLPFGALPADQMLPTQTAQPLLDAWDIELATPSDRVRAERAIGQVVEDALNMPKIGRTAAVLSANLSEFNPPLSVQFAERSTALDPESAYAWFIYGAAQLANGQRSEAVAAFRKSQSLPVDEYSWLLGQLMDHLIAGNDTAAGAEYRRIMAGYAPLPGGLGVALGVYGPVKFCDAPGRPSVSAANPLR